MVGKRTAGWDRRGTVSEWGILVSFFAYTLSRDGVSSYLSKPPVNPVLFQDFFLMSLLVVGDWSPCGKPILDPNSLILECELSMHGIRIFRLENDIHLITSPYNGSGWSPIGAANPNMDLVKLAWTVLIVTSAPPF